MDESRFLRPQCARGGVLHQDQDSTMSPRFYLRAALSNGPSRD